MHISLSVGLSVISLCVSIVVAWVTLFRRGTLHMTRPVQIAFVFENGKPKIFMRTLLYATGKRGYIIEHLYLVVTNPRDTRTFSFWGYGERNELMVAGGLRIDEEGVAFNHHFLETNEQSDFRFLPGNYEIKVYASVVNRRSPQLLSSVTFTLPDNEAALMNREGMGVLFTWEPSVNRYSLSLSKPR